MKLYDCVYEKNGIYYKATVVGNSKIEAETKLGFFKRSNIVICNEKSLVIIIG